MENEFEDEGEVMDCEAYYDALNAEIYKKEAEEAARAKEVQEELKKWPKNTIAFWSLDDEKLTNKAVNFNCFSDKEPLSTLTSEYQSGSVILREKIKVLNEEYAAIRRIMRDGNSFFRSFMFSYLEHFQESEDRAEVLRMEGLLEQCTKTFESLGYDGLDFDGTIEAFLEELESVVGRPKTSISIDEYLRQGDFVMSSSYVGIGFRLITSGEIQKRQWFFRPLIKKFSKLRVEQFCKSTVEPTGEESDDVHITALSDALGVPVRVVYLDRGVSLNHHDFIPAAGGSSATMKPYITLLYRPGHYDILYPK